jgi:hypothetical protein
MVMRMMRMLMMTAKVPGREKFPTNDRSSSNEWLAEMRFEGEANEAAVGRIREAAGQRWRGKKCHNKLVEIKTVWVGKSAT